MEIEVQKMTGSWYKLFIDGKIQQLPGLATSKMALKNFLKRQFNIDLRTDVNIKRNYTE